jgi:hypothetical protein
VYAEICKEESLGLVGLCQQKQQQQRSAGEMENSGSSGVNAEQIKELIAHLRDLLSQQGPGDGRPHIGLPGWRADGPFSRSSRHAFGSHGGPWNCRSPGGRSDNRRISNLLEQLREVRWWANHGPRDMRARAWREVHRLERQLHAPRVFTA